MERLIAHAPAITAFIAANSAKLLHGKSEYDILQFTIRDDTEGKWWIYARKMILDESRVELLSEVEAGRCKETRP
jgi:hypothetical protein